MNRPPLAAVLLARAAALAAGWASTIRSRRPLPSRASNDRLTGLLDRSGLAQAAVAAQSQRGTGGAALLLVRLDQLDAVHDRWGDAVGDAVLQQVAGGLQRWAAEQGGTAARLGADRFAVLLSGRGDRAAAAVAARMLRRTLTRPYPVPASIAGSAGGDSSGGRAGNGGGVIVPVQASVGAAVVPAGRRLDLGELLDAGDSAMHEARRSPSGWALRSAGTGPDPTGPGTALALAAPPAPPSGPAPLGRRHPRGPARPPGAD